MDIKILMFFFLLLESTESSAQLTGYNIVSSLLCIFLLLGILLPGLVLIRSDHHSL